MKRLNSVFDFYIKSSAHLSICLVTLSLISYNTFDIDINEIILFCSFAATLVVYNYIKFFSISYKNNYGKQKSVITIKIITIFILVILGSLLFYLSYSTIILGSLILMFCLAYVYPLYGLSKNIRNFGGLKIFIVAICWSATSVLIPVFESSINFEQNSMLIFFQRFFIVFAYTLPFEIRDLKHDLPSLKTIPQIYGIKKTKYIAIASLLIFFMFSIGLHIQNPVFFYSELSIVIICAGLILFSNENQQRYFASFFVESVPIFWLVIILVFKNLFN